MANSTGRPIAPLVLSSEERDYLERQVRRHRLARSLSDRCELFSDALMACPARLLEASLAFTNIQWANGGGAS
jgi:hypothetical protein